MQTVTQLYLKMIGKWFLTVNPHFKAHLLSVLVVAAMDPPALIREAYDRLPEDYFICGIYVSP